MMGLSMRENGTETVNDTGWWMVMMTTMTTGWISLVLLLRAGSVILGLVIL